MRLAISKPRSSLDSIRSDHHDHLVGMGLLTVGEFVPGTGGYLQFGRSGWFEAPEKLPDLD